MHHIRGRQPNYTWILILCHENKTFKVQKKRFAIGELVLNLKIQGYYVTYIAIFYIDNFVLFSDILSIHYSISLMLCNFKTMLQ